MKRSATRRRGLSRGFETLESRRMLSCTPIGDTSVVCYSSEGPGAPESAWLPAQSPTRAIEGYTSEASVGPGELLKLHVSTSPAANYRVEIFRLGWYDGEGGRLVAQLPANPLESIAGTPQLLPEPDPVTFEVDADWSATDAFVVPEDWESGYYTANLILTSGANAGKAHSIPFIVRAEPAKNSNILVHVPTNTWQAYNYWGGHSLYDPQPADKVSYDRPYLDVRSIFRYELPLVRYLEREGFDIEYVTNVASHRDPTILLDHNLIITIGHDEYWTSETRTGFEAARDSGVNLVFFGANTAYWQVRHENGEQTIVGYKVSPQNVDDDPEPDPAKKSMLFRNLIPARPECELLGVQYVGGHTVNFTSNESEFEDYVVETDSLTDPWFDGTGISVGAVFENIVGYEWDTAVASCRTDLTTLFRYDGSISADAVKYTASSGATVFSTGTMAFSYALDDWRPYDPAVTPPDQRLQSFVRNVLNDLGGSNASIGSTVEILATGYTGTEQMQLLIDEVPVQTWDDIGGDFQQREFISFLYEHPTLVALRDIRVAFTNDGLTETGADRNLAVDALILDGVRYESESPSTYSVGTWSNDTRCAGGNKQSETLHCSGAYFQYDTSIPDPSAPDLVAASDSGISDTDNITNVTQPTFAGSAPSGSNVTLLSNIDGVIGSAAITEGAWTVTSDTVLSEGEHTITAVIDDMTTTPPLAITIDSIAPTVSIEQSGLQADPTSESAILFDVLFSEPVVTFVTSDILLGGTAGANTAVIVGAAAQYTVTVSGMSSSGTVVADVLSGAATDIAGNVNSASTSIDNVVTFEQTLATSTIEILAAGYTGTEQMQLLIDEVPVQTWDSVGGDFQQREFISFVYEHPTPVALRDIRVAFTNDGLTETGADRNLAVDALIFDGVRYESESPSTYSVGTWSNDTRCAGGNKQSETLHCGGAYFQYDTSEDISTAGLSEGEVTPTNEPFDPMDVDQSGEVTAADALMVINALNTETTAQSEYTSRSSNWFRAEDVNRDGVVTPSDALLVINRINQRHVRPPQLGVLASSFEFSSRLKNTWHVRSTVTPSLTLYPEVSQIASPVTASAWADEVDTAIKEFHDRDFTMKEAASTAIDDAFDAIMLLSQTPSVRS